jgi:hypothetical protein
MKTVKVNVQFDNTEIEIIRVLYLLSQNEYEGKNDFLNNILESGDNFVSASNLYGGTYNQFKVGFKYLRN